MGVFTTSSPSLMKIYHDSVRQKFKFVLVMFSLILQHPSSLCDVSSDVSLEGKATAVQSHLMFEIKSPVTAVVNQNAATLFCCEASELFCGLEASSVDRLVVTAVKYSRR